MQKTDVIAKLKRNIHRTRVQLEQEKDALQNIYDRGATPTIHAGWNVGYYQGKLSALENILDELTEQTTVVSKDVV